MFLSFHTVHHRQASIVCHHCLCLTFPIVLFQHSSSPLVVFSIVHLTPSMFRNCYHIRSVTPQSKKRGFMLFFLERKKRFMILSPSQTNHFEHNRNPPFIKLSCDSNMLLLQPTINNMPPYKEYLLSKCVYKANKSPCCPVWLRNMYDDLTVQCNHLSMPLPY